MINTIKQAFKKAPKQAFIILGLSIIGIGITMSLLLSNGSNIAKKNDIMICEAQPEKQAVLAEFVKGEVGSLLPTANGRGYAGMEFNDAHGISTNIAAFSGKPLLVNFWATWCGPCREEMPSIDNLAAMFEKDIFEVITINLDSGKKANEKALKFLTEIDTKNLTLYADPTYEAFDILKANGVALGLPATLLLDSSGCEIAVLQGPAEWDSEEALELINKLIEVEKI